MWVREFKIRFKKESEMTPNVFQKITEDIFIKMYKVKLILHFFFFNQKDNVMNRM